MWFNKYYLATFIIYNMHYIWADYTNTQTDYWEKNSSNVVFAIHQTYS